jgi:hypothetical protein
MTTEITVTNNGPDALLFTKENNRFMLLPNTSRRVFVDNSKTDAFTIEAVSLGDPAPPEEPAPPPSATVTPASLGMTQNDESRKLIGPEFWFYSTLQAESAPTNDARVRIMLNCGCDAHGVWRDANGDPIPAAGRLFEQADTPAERERLRRYNYTPAVYDIAIVQGQPRLALDRHVAAVTGLTPTGKYPNFYAIRAADEAALSECLQAIAASRGNPGA